MKKVVVFGGGTGLSYLLTGLKLFPIDVTAVITVSDDGSSTGQLKKELDIPAVGDVGKVLISMANVDKDFIKLLRYRFSKESFLENHPVRNILLAALIDIKGSLIEATKYMSDILQINGTILPLTEERVDLVGIGNKKEKYYGEESVSQNIKKIKKLKYDKKFKVTKEVLKKISEADLIIFSSGSLYTSIIPHLIAKEVEEALDKAKAPIMYVSNLVTQPGETDNYSLSDHIKVLNSYLKNRKIDLVIANNAKVDNIIAKKYNTLEHKKMVKFDKLKTEKLGTRVIADKIYYIDNGVIRHDSLKTSYLIFSYLMEEE